MSIKSTLLVSLGVLAITGGAFAYRWASPCESCMISKAIESMGGPRADSANILTARLDENKTPPATQPATPAVSPTKPNPAVPATPSAAPAATSSNTDAKSDAKEDKPVQPVTITPAKSIRPDAVFPDGLQQAMFGAGCFWGVEAKLRAIPGVIEAASGYSGGNIDEPTYKLVCQDVTGHAEVVHLIFDPKKVSYRELVQTFFKLHDPTQMNRQGPDVGTQYRSAIFFYSEEQQKQAQAVKNELTTAKTYRNPIATEISKADTFWRAEEYHQRYLEKRGLKSCGTPIGH